MLSCFLSWSLWDLFFDGFWMFLFAEIKSTKNLINIEKNNLAH